MSTPRTSLEAIVGRREGALLVLAVAALLILLVRMAYVQTVWIKGNPEWREDQVTRGAIGPEFRAKLRRGLKKASSILD